MINGYLSNYDKIINRKNLEGIKNKLPNMISRLDCAEKYI